MYNLYVLKDGVLVPTEAGLSARELIHEVLRLLGTYALNSNRFRVRKQEEVQDGRGK